MPFEDSRHAFQPASSTPRVGEPPELALPREIAAFAKPAATPRRAGGANPGARLRILHVIESGGGSGRHLADLCSRLAARGHEVHAVVNPRRLEAGYLAGLLAGGVQVVKAPLGRRVGAQDLASVLWLKQWLAVQDPFDVIHAHSSKAGGIVRLIAPDDALRVYTPHAFRSLDPTLGWAPALACRGIERLLRAATDLLICVSEEERRHAIDELGYEPERAEAVLNGVGRVACADRAALRRELGLEPDAIVFVFVGRLCRQKDPERFCAAAMSAAKRDPRIRAVVLGDGELAAALPFASPAVRHFRGLRAEAFLPAFDALVCTSRYEGMPYIFAEALHAGLPIISSDVGGVSAAVADGGNGLVLPSSASAEAFAAAMLRCAASASRRARWSAVSRALAAQFDVEAMVSTIEDAYFAGLCRKGPAFAKGDACPPLQPQRPR